jgi:hypothetical protein
VTMLVATLSILLANMAAGAPAPATVPATAGNAPRASDSESRCEVDPIAVGALLRLYAERSRHTRRSIITTSVVTGAALLATGIILNDRQDEVSRSIGVGLIAGGAAPPLFSAMLLRPSGIETVSADYDALLSSGADAAYIRRAIEDEWRQAAESGHRKRIIAGGVETALGGALTAAGTYLLLAKPVWGMSRNGQYEVASVLVGPGVPIFSLGARSLSVDSLEETSWKAYAAMFVTAQPTVPPVTFGIAPARGGLFAAMSTALW